MQHHETNEKTILGFWIYLMTDLIMFGVLFAVYAVLRGNAFGGPAASELFSMPLALTETLLLLASSFTCGLAMIAVHKKKIREVYAWFSVTFVLGAVFLLLELKEFSQLAAEGNSWTRSAFLSSFFALVGTHGLHIAIGLFWIAVMFFIIRARGLTAGVVSQFARLALFWHFLDIVWIFIFTIVYLYAHV